MSPLFTIYLIGVLIGLWRTDGRPLTKMLVALTWPLGVAAFVVTISGLFVAALIALVAPRT